MVHPHMPHGLPPPPPAPAPFPPPPSGYYPGHLHQYPPMYGHPQPVPFSVKPRSRHIQPKSESLTNDSHDHISTLKRKASLNQVESTGSAAQTQNGSNGETGVLAHGSVTTEATKKQRVIYPDFAREEEGVIFPSKKWVANFNDLLLCCCWVYAKFNLG